MDRTALRTPLAPLSRRRAAERPPYPKCLVQGPSSCATPSSATGLFWLVFLALCLSAASATAHVGNPNVIHEGFAGNIPVRVIIRPPGVVPGLASIDVRVLTNAVTRVTVLPVHWRAGVEGAPPPDVGRPVEGEPNLYHADLWLMATGAYSVHVAVETAHGSGKLIVPVNSLATTRLPMSPLLTGILIALGLLLFFLATSVAGAAVRESVLEPGLPVPARRRWLGRAATLVAAAAIVTAILGGKSWWDSVDRDYRNNRMFKPIPVIAVARWEQGRQILQLTVDEKKAGNAWAPLVPDHGRLMHLFLIDEFSLTAFAHLHPARQSSAVFSSALPELPPGRYRVFADVTHESGLAQTLTATVTLTAQDPSAVESTATAASPVPDVEDSSRVEPPAFAAAPASNPRRRALGSGLEMIWEEPGAIGSATPLTLKFRVVDQAGQIVPLEPYMGMLSHLILSKDDGSVFTHLHPAGTISMASQQVFQIRAGEKPPKRITAAMMEKLCQVPGPELLQQPISFPYEFPKPGHYTFWVQVKIGGAVKTARFEVEVGS